MSANLFAAIRPEEVGANHVGKFICRYSPGGSRGESCRRIDSLLFARRVGANHAGELIRRYSPGESAFFV
jgi:hypothetical protein